MDVLRTYRLSLIGGFSPNLTVFSQERANHTPSTNSVLRTEYTMQKNNRMMIWLSVSRVQQQQH